MAKLGNLDYDQNEYDRNKSGGGSVPDGTYNVEIVEAKQKLWDDGGVQIGITYKIIDGDLTDRVFFDNLQVVHKNSQVQDIARSQLHKICDNLNVDWPLSDDELLLGGLQTVVLKTKVKDGKAYQNIVARDPLQTGKVTQANTAAASAGATAAQGANGAAATPW